MTKRKMALTVGLVAMTIVGAFSVYEVSRAWIVIRALEAIGPADVAEVPRVVTLLDDYDPAIRQPAAVALARIGPPAKAATPALVRTLKDRSAQMRGHAASALGHIKPGAEVVPPLLVALDDEDTWVRYCAAFALGQHGPLAEAAIPKLVEHLPDPEMGGKAAEALALIGGTAAKGSIPNIISAMRGAKGMFRLNYAGALGLFGTDAKAAVPELLSLAQDPDAYTRQVANDALASVDPKAVPPAGGQ